jgi:hypothetical protein
LAEVRAVLVTLDLVVLEVLLALPALMAEMVLNLTYTAPAAAAVLQLDQAQGTPLVRLVGIMALALVASLYIVRHRQPLLLVRVLTA